MVNLVDLKLSLLTSGMVLSKDNLDIPGLPRSENRYCGLADGVDLILDDNIWVNVPVWDNHAQRSPFRLEQVGDQCFICRDSLRHPVQVAPATPFSGTKTARGTAMEQLATVQGRTLIIEPVHYCSFWDNNQQCHFCAPSEFIDYTPLPEEIIEIVELVMSRKLADYIHINIGYRPEEDRGLHFLEPFISALKRHFNAHISVQIHPPVEDHWIDKAYAMGIDSLFFNIEIFDPENQKRICPGRSQVERYERYFEALAYAAKIFPAGAVVSDLIVGLEPTKFTMQGIDALCKIRVLPRLPVFRPFAGSGLASLTPPLKEVIMPVFEHLYKSVNKAKLNTGYITIDSCVISPIEANFLAGDKPPTKSLLQKIITTRVGSRITRNILEARRGLMVRSGNEND